MQILLIFVRSIKRILFDLQRKLLSFCHLVSAFGATLNSKHPNDVHHTVPVDPLYESQLHAKHERSFWSNPTSETISYGTKLHFAVNATGLGTECFESPSFTLNKLQWKVKLCKATATQNNRVEDALDGYLIYSFDSFDSDWISEALAVFQVQITNEKIDGKIVKKLKHEFNKEEPQRSIELIDWSALLANCVDDEQFSVDVEVFVSPKRNNAIDMTRVAADMRIVVDDVSELGETTAPMVVLQGIGWQVDILIDLENVAVFLKQTADTGLGVGLDENEWSWDVTMSLSLLPVSNDTQPITKQFTHSYYLERNFGYTEFVTFANFTKSYVRNDKAIFVVNLKVDPPKPLWKIENELDSLNKLF